MLKNILKYIGTIVMICCVLFLLSLIKNNLNDEYKGVLDLSFAINDSAYGETNVYNSMGQTFVGMEDSSNSYLFEDTSYALLVDETTGEIYASYNAHRRMYPASMTKLMTAIIVCERLESGQISEDDIVTVLKYYDLTYDGVGLNNLTVGSQISVKDLMYGLLIESNNYYALILADYIAGSQEAFCTLMNDKAYELGATNTHFTNPHGLDEPEHYSTAYDMYLILKEADTYDYIRQIDTYSTYSYTYIDGFNNYMYDDVSATSLFAHGYVTLPANFSIRTWKTGTTSGAGNCLALCLTKGDHTYYLVTSDADSRSELYDAVIELLCLVE